jgi:hypothetical protein
MERERDDAVRRLTRLVKAVHQLDVHILVERAGEPVARTGQNAPPPAVVTRATDRTVVGRVAQPKHRQTLQGTIEQNDARGGSTPRREVHEGKVPRGNAPGKANAVESMPYESAIT